MFELMVTDDAKLGHLIFYSELTNTTELASITAVASVDRIPLL